MSRGKKDSISNSDFIHNRDLVLDDDVGAATDDVSLLSKEWRKSVSNKKKRKKEMIQCSVITVVVYFIFYI